MRDEEEERRGRKRMGSLLGAVLLLYDGARRPANTLRPETVERERKKRRASVRSFVAAACVYIKHALHALAQAASQSRGLSGYTGKQVPDTNP